MEPRWPTYEEFVRHSTREVSKQYKIDSRYLDGIYTIANGGTGWTTLSELIILGSSGGVQIDEDGEVFYSDAQLLLARKRLRNGT